MMRGPFGQRARRNAQDFPNFFFRRSKTFLETNWDVSPPSRAVFFLLIAAAAVHAMTLNRWKIPTEWPLLNLIYMVLLQFLATLRLVFLLTLVWWSSLLKLRWNTRELRIVTGLGLYILVTFLVVVLHAHDMSGVQYHWLDQLLVASYLWALCLWMLASTTKVAEQT